MRSLLFNPFYSLLMLVLCTGVNAAAQPLTIGSKKFTESVILAEMATQLLNADSLTATHRDQLGGTQFLWKALLAGDIDAYPEYTGTILEEILAGQAVPVDSIADALAVYGVRMTAPLGFNNTYALGMTSGRADALGIRTISDLRGHPNLRFGFSNEFMDRADGWPGLRQAYRLPQQNVRGMDHDLSYRGIESGTIDVTDLYATDAEIAHYGLQVLEDDQRYFPEYKAVFLYRDDLPPDAAHWLHRLKNTIPAGEMTRLNARAVIDGVPETRVAADFLNEHFRPAQAFAVIEATWTRRLWQHTKEHLFLVSISLLAAILVAIPLGVVAAKVSALEKVILGTVGVIYTIPSLALLVFMIPLLGIGGPPAMVALFLYSLLPIVRNTHAGLHDIPPPLLESAEALGLPPMARLRQIELPLAARSILAGIQTSAVINVGTATLGALIGAGGYGQPILTGIRLDDTGLILQGAIPAAVLALLVQCLFDLAERLVVAKGLRV
jgi:osmoprotectant transport system permease protein